MSTFASLKLTLTILFSTIIALPAAADLQLHCSDTLSIGLYVPLAEQARQELCAASACAPEVSIPENPPFSETVCATDVSEAFYTLQLGACNDHCLEATQLIIDSCIERGWTSGYATTEDESEYYFISDKATSETFC